LPAGFVPRECGAARVRHPGMNMTILIAAGVGMTLPCILLWLSEQRRRLRAQP
jgi:hypothetical protein